MQYTERFIAFFGVQSSVVVLGNTLGAYVFACVLFLLGIIVFAFLQFIVLSWLSIISKRTKTDLDDAFVKMVWSFKPPFYAFFSFWYAVRSLTVTGVAYGVVTAILVVWVVYQMVIVVGILVEDVLFRYLVKDDDETTRSAIHLVANMAKGIMWVLGILLALSNFGIDVTSLLAGAGIAGIAVAFALQGILSDLFSSFSLYFDRPFKVGDFIVAGGTSGTVKRIGVKTTRIQALTGEEVVLPNQDLTSTTIQNFRRMEERRVVFGFGVLYETDAKRIEEIPASVRKIIESVDDTRFDRAHFKGFGDSSLDFEVVYYVLDRDYAKCMDIQQKINLALLRLFEERSIGFAYPTRTVYVNTSN